MLLAYDQNISNTDGFALMQNSTSLKTLIFRISVMIFFDSDKLCDDECLNEFIFLKNNISVLAEASQISERLSCFNRINVSISQCPQSP